MMQKYYLALDSINIQTKRLSILTEFAEKKSKKIKNYLAGFLITNTTKSTTMIAANKTTKMPISHR